MTHQHKWDPTMAPLRHQGGKKRATVWRKSKKNQNDWLSLGGSKNWSIKIWPLGWHNETVWMAKPPMHSSKAIKYLEKHLNRVNYVVQVKKPWQQVCWWAILLITAAQLSLRSSGNLKNSSFSVNCRYILVFLFMKSSEKFVQWLFYPLNNSCQREFN